MVVKDSVLCRWYNGAIQLQYSITLQQGEEEEERKPIQWRAVINEAQVKEGCFVAAGDK